MKYSLLQCCLLMGVTLFMSAKSYSQWVLAKPSLVSASALISTGTKIFSADHDAAPVTCSTDNGTTWEEVNFLPNSSVASFAVQPNGRGGTNLFAGGSGAFLSTDGGLSWTDVSSGLTNYSVNWIYSLFHNPNDSEDANLLAGTFVDGVYHSTDNGATWFPLNSGLTVDGYLVTVDAFTADGRTLFAGTSGNGIYRLADNDTSWTAVSIPENGEYGDETIYDLAFCNGYLFAAGSMGVYRSSDDGGSWTHVDSGLTDHASKGYGTECIKLEVFGTDLFVGTEGNAVSSAGIYISTNNGDTWTNVSSNLPIEYDGPGAFMVSNGYLFAAIDSGIYRRPLSEMITAVKGKENHLPSRFMLEQNYPNPFNPSTTISYDLPEAAYVTLKVFDMLGREIAILVDEQKSAGSYQAIFDGSSFASGVYFYMLEAGTHTATKKMLMIK